MSENQHVLCELVVVALSIVLAITLYHAAYRSAADGRPATQTLLGS